MARLTRRGFTVGGIAIVSGACGGLTSEDRSPEPTDELPAPDPIGPGPAPFTPGPTPPDPKLLFGPVNGDTPPPSVIWSWTTEEQALEIRRDKILFTRESSPTLGRGYLFDVLEARAAKGDAAATRLIGSELAKGRFGWHNPWATVAGATTGETYGTDLLKIEMRADTWFARVSSSHQVIDFVDAAGKLVADATALASFDGVGGILFHNDVASSGPCSTASGRDAGTGGGGMVYREIYVGNEARLATFSHRTAAILGVLDGHIAELSALRDWLDASGVFFSLDWTCNIWRTNELSSSVGRYLASLAFATGPYYPDATTIGALVTKLTSARFTPDPFTHAP